MSETGTIVVAKARTALLECLAYIADLTTRREAEAEAGVIDIATGRSWTPGMMPTHVPLFVEDWRTHGLDPEDIHLAARECTKLGEIEYNDSGRHPNGPMVRITPAGYAWIRRDAPPASTTAQASLEES
jgi:hypothetical protein